MHDVLDAITVALAVVAPCVDDSSLIVEFECVNRKSTGTFGAACKITPGIFNNPLLV